MPTSMLMPSLSPTMEEGVLAKWLVKEGDFIKQGTMLCSVETDKTTVDYESMDEGFLRKILVPAGSPAKVNQLIAILSDEKDEDISAHLEKATKKSEELLASKGGAKPAAASASNGAGPSSASYTPAPAHAAVAMAPEPRTAPGPVSRTESSTNAGVLNDGGRVKASPLAKKMAEDAGIPLQNVSGTGPNGRIIRRDIEGYKPEPAAIGAGANAASGKPAGGKTEGPVQRPLYGSLAPIGQTQDLPLNMMRKTIGKRLLESTQGIPNFFVTMKVEMAAVNALRAQLNRAPGYKISVNDIVTKATAFALREFPQVNSSFHGDFIRQNANIDICIAVSIEGGLITPIVRDADVKGLGTLSAEIKQLVSKAKSGKLAPAEYQGGTFTISNLGMYGVEEFTAIINPPQSGILAVGGIQQEVYLQDGVAKQRDVMKVTMTSDHRVVDGALSAQFLSALKSLLENPTWLML
ncbi:MAG: pyruvate dehydrogenase complex dihydrolipoamide acetyltransferase [Fibrobacterota bacterium]|nr:pyruvate dehydrogenase complex dihydrolipoamide acetyltransferase [Fibrobacterota bacterium]